ncbi:PAS domain S-box protein [Microcoleus vaginatus GB1-A2]|uniref:PAS domain S-box protein n=1 Tax=Microcoleus vaginatus TaxID=119532 RepID=UPI001687BC48|nr:PAS domain S-box protein [Microcoleus sp. FACHB-61]
MQIPLPENERERLKALESYQILDSPPEAEFNQIVQLAQEICETPIALLSLMDSDRQWFKAKIGLEAPETHRDRAFCSHAILQPDLFIIPDTLKDKKFADNPLVVADPHIRFYAGMPLLTPEGHALGTLCTLDRVPRELTPEQEQALKNLAKQVLLELQKRRNRLAQQEKVAQHQRRKKSYRRFLWRVSAGFGYASAITLGLGTAFYWLTAQVIESERWVSHTLEVIAKLEDINSDIHKANSAVQTYAIAGQTRHLQAYSDSFADIEEDIKILQQLTADNAVQQQRIQALRALIREWQAILQQAVNLRQNQQLQAIPEFFARNLSTSETAVDSLLQQMEQTENQLLGLRTASAKRSAEIATSIGIIAIVLLLLVGIAVYFQIYREIARRKHTEEQLEQQRDFTDTILNTARALVVVVNRSGKIIRFNQACEQITGYTAAEAQDKYVWEFVFPPAEAEVVKAIYQPLQSDRFPYQCENHWTAKNGFPRLIAWSNTAILDEQGEVEYAIDTGIDITDRRQVEEERDRFFSLSLDLFCIFNLDGYFERLNPAWEKTLGWKEEELLAKQFMNFVHPEERRATLRKLWKSGEEMTAFENRYLCKDGSYRWLLWNGVRFNGKVYAAAHDITSRKQREAEVQSALENEKELNQLKSKFISLVSHEFRTPLTTILSSTELLEVASQKFIEERKKRHFKFIKNAVSRMTTLLEDVLVMSKAESGKLQYNPQLMNLNLLCSEITEEIQQGIGNNHKVYFSDRGDASNVYMDSKLLHHIFTNLLSNAIKYSSQGSTVKFELNIEGDTALVEVKDEGIGIPPEELPELFQRFHRAGNVGNIPGTGLGLSIVKTCVDLHGGSIEAASEMGVGTKFIVRLPLNREEVVK